MSRQFDLKRVTTERSILDRFLAEGKNLQTKVREVEGRHPEEIVPDVLRKLGVVDFARHYVPSIYAASLVKLIESLRKCVANDNGL